MPVGDRGELSIRLPVVTDVNIEKFTGATIDVTSSLSKNVIFGKYVNGSIYATQRPSFDTFGDASVTVSDTAGRGAYYWNSSNGNLADLYFVNNDTLYKGDYGTVASAGLTAGTQRVYIAELGGELFISDPENNEGWTWDGSTLTDVGAADAQFPSNITTLAHGVAILDQTLYLLGTNGVIYGSALTDAGSWNAANIISAEKIEDAGVAIAEHHDRIIAFNSRSIEFFYDAANPVGSPLSSQSDVSYKLGCADGKSVVSDGDVIYFAGITSSGEVGIYKMADFTPQKISNPSIDSYLTTATQIDNASILGSAFSSGGSSYYALTLYTTSTQIDPIQTIVYSSSTSTWSIWEHASSAVDHFPVIDWTTATANRVGQGILTNGDVIQILDDFNPQDSVGASIYVTEAHSVTGVSNLTFDTTLDDITRSSGTIPSLDGFDDGDLITVSSTASNNGNHIVTGTPSISNLVTTSNLTNEANTSAVISRSSYMDDGYISNTAAAGDAIEMVVRVGHFDGGTYSDKTLDQLRIACDETDAAQTVTVKWSDGNHGAFTAGRDIDISSNKNKLVGCGRFKNRTFELNYSGSEQIRVQGLDLKLRKHSV